MKLRTILLVACLMTIPSVAADNPVHCEQNGDREECSVSTPPPPGQASTSESCQALYLWYQVGVLPVGGDVNVHCIVNI